MPETTTRIADVFSDHLEVAKATEAHLADRIADAGSRLAQCLLNGNTILLCGNGGSAADAQHLAGEWVGRFLLERRGLPSIALHANTTAMTAIGNDYGFDEVYSRQVEAHGKPGDILIAITTSGNSENILRAARRAKEIGIEVFGMTGQGGGKLAELCDILFDVPSKVTARVQEMHIVIGHLLCELSETEWQARQA